jgi:hypothetical protein
MEKLYRWVKAFIVWHTLWRHDWYRKYYREWCVPKYGHVARGYLKVKVIRLINSDRIKARRCFI